MNRFKDNSGGAAVEFAIILPIWLTLFFGLIDYGWYLTNLMVMESAVANGARAGVKVQYWSDEGEAPYDVAAAAVKSGFWLSGSLTNDYIKVNIKDADNNKVDLDEAEYSDYEYLEVRVLDFEYPLLVGYLWEKVLPRSISAVSLMAFP